MSRYAADHDLVRQWNLREGGGSTVNPATYPKKDGTEGTAWYLMGPTPGLMLIVR